jgi:hypothetical protein
MGVHPNVSHDKFPKQGKMLHRRVMVCFNYDPYNAIRGKIVRDDVEAPFRTIIALDNGLYVEAEECHYHWI